MPAPATNRHSTKTAPSPKVSVIIPVYNSADYIAKTLQSVFNQTFTDFEIITVDDGSPDHSKEIIAEFSDKHPGKIRYIHQENKGIAGARNTGIRQAKGELIAFLDADDLWLPNRLQATVDCFEKHPEIGATCSKNRALMPDGTIIDVNHHNKRNPNGDIYEALILRETTVSCLTATIKKAVCEKIGLMDENKQCMGVDDRDFWIRVAKEFSFKYIDEYLAVWRFHENNFSSNLTTMYEARLYVHDKLSKQSLGEKKLYRRGLFIINKEMGDSYLTKNRFSEAFPYFIKAIAAWPLNVWAYYGVFKTLLKKENRKGVWLNRA